MDKHGDQDRVHLRQPALGALQGRHDLYRKLEEIHAALRAIAPAISRIGIALYDEPSGLLKTFVYSMDGDTPLQHYQSRLEDAPALRDLVGARQARVVEDLEVFAGGSHEHTRKINERGYRSSYTFPMILADELVGFIFFNATETAYFRPDLLPAIDVYGHLITHVVMQEIRAVRTLLSALREANDMVHYRDPETGRHLERMSRYARIIARHLAKTGQHAFTDEYIENLFLFAPLHDVGKIGIPDEILLKPARLDEEEFRVMQTHTTKGREIVDAIIHNFGLDQQQNMELLRNIAEFHHEAMDGSGYPQGRQGDEIPIESRITAVADIFDALTSERPYKPAWDNQKALAMLRSLAGHKLDSDCVDALEASLDQVLEVQRRFAEDPCDSD